MESVPAERERAAVQRTGRREREKKGGRWGEERGRRGWEEWLSVALLSGHQGRCRWSRHWRDRQSK